MTVVDKRGLLARLQEGSRHAPVSLELGCGTRKRRPDAIGIDARDLPGVDLVGDALEVLASLPDACAADVFSSHFLEHVDDPRRILGELARVLRPEGLLELVVPHFSNPYFYSDPTHRRFFGLYTLSYFVRDPLLRRRVPAYTERLPLVLEAVELRFDSPRAFPVRRAVKRALGRVVNLSVWTREFYEENLSAVLPCYELRFALRRERGRSDAHS